MPDIRWTAAGQMEPGREYVVMASHLPLRSITSTPRFFRAVAAIREQLRGAEGLVGYTLRAKPLARRYWTLSVWTDGSALQAFMRTPPHVGVMGSLKPFMATTKFLFSGRSPRPTGGLAGAKPPSAWRLCEAMEKALGRRHRQERETTSGGRAPATHIRPQTTVTVKVLSRRGR